MIGRACVAGLAVALLAACGPMPLAEEPGVVPAHEQGSPRDLGLEGPTETTGVASSEVRAAIPLGPDFESLDGYVLRAREIALAPGGVVAVHRHERRPGVAYVLEGSVVEHRADTALPVAHAAGGVAVESSGTVHWWRNDGDSTARVFVVDIVRDDAR